MPTRSSPHFEENLDALVCADSFNLCMNGNNIVTDAGRRQAEKKCAIDIGAATESLVKDNLVAEARLP